MYKRQEETSDTLRKLLEGVVAEGSGKNAKVEGYAIGGKTCLLYTSVRTSDLTEKLMSHTTVIDGVEYISVHPTFLLSLIHIYQ